MPSTITPYLTVPDSKLALKFYENAFAAKEIGPRLTDPDGRIIHTEFQIGEATVMMADEIAEYGNASPTKLGGTSVHISLYVDDVDQVSAQAVDAGGTLAIPVSDQFYGYRSGRIVDPFGHVWILGTLIEEVPHDEMQRRVDAMFQNTGE